MWTAYQLTDKRALLSFLQQDRRYAAYAIADLDPEPFALCTWAGSEQAGRLGAVVLHYRGLEPAPLFLMGEEQGLHAILVQVLCPDGVSLACRSNHVDVVRQFYDWGEVPMWRMALQPCSVPETDTACVRLSPAHLAQLTELYALGGGDAFSPAQLAEGIFYGVVVASKLAAAGTHLFSPTRGIGTVGNVFTHPDYRGHGYATSATGAVVAELLSRGARDIVLNVAQSNTGAIRVYEKLGFYRHCAFLEGPATRRYRVATDGSSCSTNFNQGDDQNGC